MPLDSYLLIYIFLLKLCGTMKNSCVRPLWYNETAVYDRYGTTKQLCTTGNKQKNFYEDISKAVIGGLKYFLNSSIVDSRIIYIMQIGDHVTLTSSTRLPLAVVLTDSLTSLLSYSYLIIYFPFHLIYYNLNSWSFQHPFSCRNTHTSA